jgi:hypothetical protein
MGENVEDVLKKAEDTGITSSVHCGDSQDTKPAEDDAIQPENEDVSMTIDEQTSESAPEVYCHYIDGFLGNGLLTIYSPLSQ